MRRGNRHRAQRQRRRKWARDVPRGVIPGHVQRSLRGGRRPGAGQAADVADPRANWGLHAFGACLPGCIWCVIDASA